jgi:amino acid transporter
LLLRIRHPEAHRPFRCPWIYYVAPAGIAVNFLMMLFLPISSWIRLVVWLFLGLIVYFSYGYWHSLVGLEMRKKGGMPLEPCGSATTSELAASNVTAEPPAAPATGITAESPGA